MLTLTHVKKSYNSGARTFEVIRDVDARIEDGAFVVVLGPSGSGKSTLMSLMSGLEVPDSGTVSYNGTRISALSETERTAFRRRYVGYVFQSYGLIGSMTAESNVRMGADLAGNAFYRNDMEAVGIAELARERCAALSGGEQQRVAIARAAAKKPELLFLDEPTGALDEQTGKEVLRYLEDLHAKAHFTMIIVTHNDHIAQMADQILRMNSGRIISAEENGTRLHADEIGW